METLEKEGELLCILAHLLQVGLCIIFLKHNNNNKQEIYRVFELS